MAMGRYHHGLRHWPTSHSLRGKDAIWVVVDHLSKSKHFIPICTTNTASQLAPIYTPEIIRLHGVPKNNHMIVPQSSPRSVSAWLSTHRRMASPSVPFKLSKTCSAHVPCHDKVIGKSTCSLWSLPTTITTMQVSRLHHSEVLYGLKCRSPLCWDSIGERAVLGPDWVQQILDHVLEIHENMLTTQK
jgi:hypothetical protein